MVQEIEMFVKPHSTTTNLTVSAENRTLAHFIFCVIIRRKNNGTEKNSRRRRDLNPGLQLYVLMLYPLSHPGYHPGVGQNRLRLSSNSWVPSNGRPLHYVMDVYELSFELFDNDRTERYVIKSVYIWQCTTSRGHEQIRKMYTHLSAIGLARDRTRNFVHRRPALYQLANQVDRSSVLVGSTLMRQFVTTLKRRVMHADVLIIILIPYHRHFMISTRYSMSSLKDCKETLELEGRRGDRRMLNQRKKRVEKEEVK
ncbi:hypothetical protein ANN_04312 [Periplaneta americana]|uniref:Uncharacterized protein n=1 Tax=Periplaneta americana TaxID=6978 RepID=A0ABQ8T881_PERAM|nr:hypothetical protein ANN_04312 [Periplaneta americana]